MTESWTAADTIYFYKANRPHGYLSNFSLHPIALDGYCWPTVEHYYQAQKFAGTEFSWLNTKIRAAATPEAAAAIGRCADYCPSEDWPDRKLRVMERAVLAKFNGHPELRQLLLATGTAPIVEDSPVDYFWGCGEDRSGLNHLGKILMGVRTVYAMPGESKFEARHETLIGNRVIENASVTIIAIDPDLPLEPTAQYDWDDD
jgi:N-glycosidase YbiA